MRIAAIIISVLFLSLAAKAQQPERQMQKPGAVVQNNGAVVKKPTAITFTPTAPRQMAPLGSQPASTNGKQPVAVLPANNQSRRMVPLNPNTVVKNSN